MEDKPEKIIDAPVATPYFNVVEGLTQILGRHLSQAGLQVQGKKGRLETEVNGQKVVILIEEG